MSLTWVAPVAGSGAAAIVGVAGICATFKAGKRQQQTALEIARVSIDGQLAGLREERHQRRLEAAYTELLIMLSETHQWAVSVYPMWTSGAEDYRMPPMPEKSNRARVEAVVTAAWSPRLQQLMDPWRIALERVHNTGVAITLARATEARGQETGIDLARSIKELRECEDALWRADQVIREQVWMELQGSTTDARSPDALK
jgi:hypothetical protein